MEENKKNKMADVPMKKLFWKMGLPMIVSMVLQVLYNVVDSVFVANMGTEGALANQALTIAFPIQILIIAVGVGTGVGLNALLSKSLGEKNNEKVNKIAGNGIFLSICIYAIFLLFGAFGSKWFISFIVSLILTVIFEIFANPLSKLFGLSGGSTTEIIDICATAIRIASLGYIFMGFSVAVQGVLQSLRYAIRPLIISLLRLVIFVFPIAYLFAMSDNVTTIVWWTFPIAEVATAIISIFILKKSYKEKIENLETVKVPKSNARNLIISISREHGTNGKEIARKVAERLGVAFYDKEEMKKFAISHSLAKNINSDDELYKFYLSLDAEKDAIIKQAETIRAIAADGDCVIVGRGSDYILKDNPSLIRVFLYAPLEYRIDRIKEMYNDTYKDAKRHVLDSDKSRASYYEVISNQPWGKKENYDLCINCEVGNDKAVDVICEYIKDKK